ncbi:hypothetical protein RND81_04G223700 [Saponaria officinalis]|uniref:Uncharacterized protein n=1 Tax=Saponaria officinalis TaxID=3572 RepID=A0AAW1LP08_SAPOF
MHVSATALKHCTMSTEKNLRGDDDNNDSDDGCDGAELLAAAEDGRGADVVLSIVVKNPGLIRTADPVGNTILHMAARDGDIGTVCNLIAFVEGSHDEDLKTVFMDENVDGNTALHLALKNRHREVAYHLIKAEKWTGTILNNDWITPYELAMKAGFNEVCELSAYKSTNCSARADVEIRAVKRELMGGSRIVPVQWTELYRAIKNGDEDALITGLLMSGSKELVWQQDPLGETLLHAAATAPAMGPFRQLVQFMISNGLTDAALLGNRDGNTALHLMAQSGHLSKALSLIKAAPPRFIWLSSSAMKTL